VQTFHGALPLFDIFGPERLNTLLWLWALALHWWASRLHPHYATYVRRMEPIAWLREGLGPGFDDDDDDAAFGGYSLVPADPRGPCVHEDGGRLAVLESTEGDAAVSAGVRRVGRGVVMGPLFRVVSLCPSAPLPLCPSLP